MTPTEKCTATKFQDKKQRKDQKKKEVVEKKTESMIALCEMENQNIWHIDNGCSKHMSGDTNKFMSLRRDKKGKVTFGDNISSKIIGKATVAIRDNQIKVENVLLV